MDRDKFAQMLREGYDALDPEKEEREYIRELLRKKEQQRKKRIRTITAAAAAFILVVGAVLAVGGCFAPAEADKNSRTKVEEHNDSVIISDENAEGQEVGSESVVETDWNKVGKLKEKYPEMITFTDVPEGMEFVSVEVKKQEGDIVDISYCFSCNSNSILILQKYYTKNKQQTEWIENAEKNIEYKGYKINVNYDAEIINTTIISEKFAINVIGKISEKEVYDILDKIKAS